jgi:hypothetical protein
MQKVQPDARCVLQLETEFIEGGKLALAGSGANINRQLQAENERLTPTIRKQHMHIV